MVDRSRWQSFFDDHAPHYNKNAFTQATSAEVDFLIEALGLTPGERILDMGCGTGRHSVELARRGYVVTGVDLSAGMLAEARKAAEAAGVSVDFVQADATTYQPTRQHDAAICLCEGAFGLLGANEDPVEHGLAILRTIHAALKPGGGFMLTVLNALRNLREVTQADIDAGRFDPVGLVWNDKMELEMSSGRRLVQMRERRYVASELVLLLRVVGFDVRHVWRGGAGAWERAPLRLDDWEVMLVAGKRG